MSLLALSEAYEGMRVELAELKDLVTAYFCDPDKTAAAEVWLREIALQHEAVYWWTVDTDWLIKKGMQND